MAPQNPRTTADRAQEEASSGAQADAFRTLRQAIWTVSLPLGMLSFVLPVYGREIGADAVQIGLFFSSFSLVMVLLRPMVGTGLDRYGRRPFVLAGIAGYAASMFLFGLWTAVWGVIVARVVQGIAAACLWVAVDAIIADVSGSSRRGRSFGGISQASNQGSIVGSLIAILTISQLGSQSVWSWLFASYGLAAAVGLILAWRGLPETYSPKPGTQERPIAWSRPWALLLLIAAVTSASGAMIGPIVLFFLQDRLGASAAEVGLAYMPAALVGALVAARLGALADRLGRKPLMLFGMAVAAASSFLMPGLGSVLALAIVQAVVAAAGAAGRPARRALVADLTGGDQRGRAYGIYALAGGLGATVGPVVGGWLYERVSPAAPFYVNGAVVAVSALVLWAWLRVPAVLPTGEETG
jgi:DHA1 family multidrug resistance protein-like MFS transporter